MSPRDKRKQQIGDSVAEKAGVSEDVFEKIEKEVFESRKRAQQKEEKFEEEFGKELKKIFAESSDYITEKQAKGKIISPGNSYGSREEWYQERPEEFINSYNAGEEWLMSEGEGDLAKGFINNFRSSIGTGAEDFAYWLNDYAPWYKPAGRVVEKNTAGEIRAQAQKQFLNAKAAGANEKYVDLMDSVSRGLGYNALGFKAGNYIQGGAETFEEYRKLRDSGYTKEEATAVLIRKVPLAILSAKADDYIGRSGKIDDALYGTTHTFDPKDNKKFREALNSRKTNDIIITEEQIGKKIGEHTKEYNLNPGNAEDRKEMERIINDIIDNADEVVEGKWKGQEGPMLFYRKG